MANYAQGNSIRLIHWTVSKKTAFASARQGLAVATLLLMVVSSGWAQEIDSSVLQAEAAAKKAQEAATVKPPEAAPPQSSGTKTAPAQAAPQTSSPQASAPQSGQPQTPPSNPFFMLPLGT